MTFQRNSFFESAEKEIRVWFRVEQECLSGSLELFSGSAHVTNARVHGSRSRVSDKKGFVVFFCACNK